MESVTVGLEGVEGFEPGGADGGGEFGDVVFQGNAYAQTLFGRRGQGRKQMGTGVRGEAGWIVRVVVVQCFFTSCQQLFRDGDKGYYSPKTSRIVGTVLPNIPTVSNELAYATTPHLDSRP